MLCDNPFVSGGVPYRCGRCTPCTINRRRTWAHRLMMEAALRKDNAFLTLTYDDSNLPVQITCTGSELPTLNPKHLQDWLKRFRAAISPLRIRFYACGEYGDENFRPHYHALVFGFPVCIRGKTRTDSRGRTVWRGCCEFCDLVGKTWGHGDVQIGEVEIGAAQYVAGYVTKKMTRFDDPRLQGRHPEFVRQSKQEGGLGVEFIRKFVAPVFQQYEDRYLEFSADVPSALTVGGKVQPLGRYLRQELRKAVGRSPKAPPSAFEEYKQTLWPLQEAAIAAQTGLKAAVLARYVGKIRSLEAKSKIYKQRRNL